MSRREYQRIYVNNNSNRPIEVLARVIPVLCRHCGYDEDDHAEDGKCCFETTYFEELTADNWRCTCPCHTSDCGISADSCGECCRYREGR